MIGIHLNVLKVYDTILCYLTLRGGLYQRLPGVGGVGDHKPKLKVPLLKTTAFEQNLYNISTFVMIH